MQNVTLNLSLCVLEQINQLADALKVKPADVISFFLEGSTYLQSASPKSVSFCR